MSPFAHIQLRREGGVEHLVLNRPEVRNAFHEGLVAEITGWARNAATDPDLRAVVIAGAGPSFCAGADLEWMTRMAAGSHEDNLRDARAASAMFEAVNALPVPVIARVHGAALGGGAGLVAVADIAVADERATFGFTEVKLGLIPAVVAPYVLAKIGHSAARELFITGRRFEAGRAREIGLVHMVVSSDQLDHAVRHLLDDLVANGREAMSAAKVLLREIAYRSGSDAAPLTAERLAARRASAEAQERMRRFLRR